jgi:hypothetical protein
MWKEIGDVSDYSEHEELEMEESEAATVGLAIHYRRLGEHVRVRQNL